MVRNMKHLEFFSEFLQYVGVEIDEEDDDLGGDRVNPFGEP